MVFRLFQLPLVALEHVLHMMNPHQLIDISMTSFKNKMTVKSFLRNKPKFQVLLGVYQEPYISIARQHESWEYGWTTNPQDINGRMKTKKHTDRIFYRIIKYSENPIEEWMIAYDHIREVLGCRFDALRWEFDSYPNQNRLIIDWIRNVQKYVNELKIACAKRKECNDEVKDLLSFLKATGRLRLENHRDDFELKIPQDALHLHVDSSKFIKYKQFLRLNHPKIALFRSILSGKEINRFLKKWMACEAHLRLEVLAIHIPGIQALHDIMRGLPHEWTTDPETMKLFEE
uniref:F-box domain-containing protein n=2 Tax=Caenorhabditis tropicalis TaxID=1561998 RepID=A0A1I7TUK9_9PELO